MSQWTHVAATIRIDALRFAGMGAPDLGKTCSFDSDDAAWDECDVPCGSEGSLQTHLWTNPSDHDLAAYTAMIWGDLRDYSSVDEVLAYLNRICAGQMVRQGVAEIGVEYQAAVIARFDGELNAWVRVEPATAEAAA